MAALSHNEVSFNTTQPLVDIFPHIHLPLSAESSSRHLTLKTVTHAKIKRFTWRRPSKPTILFQARPSVLGTAAVPFPWSPPSPLFLSLLLGSSCTPCSVSTYTRQLVNLSRADGFEIKQRVIPSVSTIVSEYLITEKTKRERRGEHAGLFPLATCPFNEYQKEHLSQIRIELSLRTRRDTDSNCKNFTSALAVLDPLIDRAR